MGGWKGSPGPLLGAGSQRAPTHHPCHRQEGQSPCLHWASQPFLWAILQQTPGEARGGVGRWGGERGCWQAHEHVATEMLAGHLLNSGGSGGPAQPRPGLL